VIHDVDATLKELLVQSAGIDTTQIDIRFEMPTREWSAAISRPTVNAYLYDLRENHDLRSNDHYFVQNGDAHIQRRRPVRVDLCYLITVWTTDIADEHQLLGRILTALLSHPTLPPEVLRGSMQNQAFPLQAWIAQPERTPQPWDFWGHVEHRMKSGLSYVITAAVEPHAEVTVHRVRERQISVAPEVPKPRTGTQT
jgi:hypothetical protein